MDPHTISVVIPVYRGEHTLPSLLAEIEPLTHERHSPAGEPYRVTEVILVHDCGPGQSAAVMRMLAEKHPFVSLVWLSRNFGQHAATLAGMAASTGEWVASLDEDGQHHPADLPKLLDTAVQARAQVVYGAPDQPAPHAYWRNASSRAAKWLVRTLLARQRVGRFFSYRLIDGEIARGLAAYCGESVYLDVALSWVADRITECTVTSRPEGREGSSYTIPRLTLHFWRLLISSGVVPLRLLALVGAGAAVVAAVLGVYVVWEAVTGKVPVQGWSSLMIAVVGFGGLLLLAMGIIAEYIGIAVSSALGRPLYMTVSDPERPFRPRPRPGPPAEHRPGRPAEPRTGS